MFKSGSKTLMASLAALMALGEPVVQPYKPDFRDFPGQVKITPAGATKTKTKKQRKHGRRKHA